MPPPPTPLPPRRSLHADGSPLFPLSGGVIRIHIADLSFDVSHGSLLVVRLRLQSIYAAAAPLHMLPLALLHAASLSNEMTNE
jgi:exoribonuclease R